jgi:hypothetical protein
LWIALSRILWKIAPQLIELKGISMTQTVKILVVTDSGGGFNKSPLTGTNDPNAFHLGEFLNVLQTTTWDGFSLQVVKAHRENRVAANIGADLVNFRFDTHDLKQYDEILLFPIRRDGDSLDVPSGSPARSSNATDAEVKAIAEFMDAGGGVFATGDHEDLGAGLCARLPRIRNMRRWYWDSVGPNGEPIAPRGTPGVFMGHPESELVNRHDTLRAGHDYDPTHPNDNYQFDDQSDNIAQEISPKIFERSSSRYIRQSWPHPLLCSPDGMVRYLPDHAHEGQCEVPANMGLTVTVAGYSQAEYPPLPSGAPLAPVVVADATVIGGHATFSPYKPPVNGKTFGVIGAYDGQRTTRAGKRLGRVVVDATWHHFFNINLSGDLGSSNAAKKKGFYAPLNPGQADHYKMIKHYFRNIVYWLIPASRRVWVFHDLIARMVRSAPFYELNPLVKIRDFNKIDIEQIIAMAKLADAYFRKAHGACASLQFVPIIVYEFEPFRKWWERYEPIVNPWVTKFEKDPRPPIGVDGQMLADVLIGSAVVAALRAKVDMGHGEGEDFNADVAAKSFSLFQRYLPESLKMGNEQMAKHFEEEAAQLARFSSELR